MSFVFCGHSYDLILGNNQLILIFAFVTDKIKQTISKTHRLLGQYLRDSARLHLNETKVFHLKTYVVDPLGSFVDVLKRLFVLIKSDLGLGLGLGLGLELELELWLGLGLRLGLG